MSFRASHGLMIVAALGMFGAVGIACGSSDAEVVACDPSVDPTCNAAGSDSGTEDASVPTADIGTAGQYPPGSTILPDGAILLPDGAVVGQDAIVGCTGGSTQCTNCLDDDKDGLIDWLDPECTGPLDNDEGSYATGIPGDNIDPCKQDCWFDGNSGSGNDGCLFDLRCKQSSANAECPYDAKLEGTKGCAPPSAKCIQYCKPLVPKGCDCAGCCQVFDAAGVPHTVKLVSTCTTESLNDPAKCPTCTQIADCSQPCGTCDFCLGKTTLPPECYGPPPQDAGPDAPPPADTGPPPPPGTCPPEFTKCSPSAPCAIGFYCLTGCCIKPPS